jgi:hypothetical protein
MNRRNLFQACAAGLAWLVGGKLPAASEPIETCTWHTPRLTGNVTVVNDSRATIKPGMVVEWTGYGMGVKIADLSGDLAGIACEDALPGRILNIAVSGPMLIRTKYPALSCDGSYETITMDLSSLEVITTR